MVAIGEAHIDALAHDCVDSMGDIFWDFDAERDTRCGFSNPYDVAVRAVRQTLQTFADRVLRIR